MKKILLLLVIATYCFKANAQPGTLDKSFGNNGIVLADFNNTSYTAIQLKDQRILQMCFDFVVAYFLDGKIDSSFGQNGLLTFVPEAPNSFAAYGLTEQEDGKFLVSGASSTGPTLFRYFSDGTIDNTFGINGKSQVTTIGKLSTAYDLRVQKDGKIVCTGAYVPYFQGPESPLMIRFNADGSLDSSYAANGINVLKDLYAFCYKMQLQDDGKAVSSGVYHNNGTDQSFLLMRYNTDGTLDSSFDNDGRSVTSIDGRFDKINAISLQKDGKIVATGQDGQLTPFPVTFIAVLRFNTDGSLDETFAKDGKLTINPVTCDGLAIAIQNNNKIVIGAQGGSKTSVDADYMLIRLLPNGELDPTFGDNGIVVTDIKGYDIVNKVILENDGKILVSGSSYNNTSPDDTYYEFSLAKYKGDPVNTITKATIIRWIKNHILHWQLQGNNADVDYYVVETNEGQSVKLNDESTYDLSTLLEANVRQLTIRIKAVMKDGSVVYSDWIIDATIPTIAIYPNPVKDVLNITGLPNTKTIINITDRNGNVLITTTAYSSAKNTNVSALKSGVYYVSVLVDGKLQTLQFIKV